MLWDTILVQMMWQPLHKGLDIHFEVMRACLLQCVPERLQQHIGPAEQSSAELSGMCTVKRAGAETAACNRALPPVLNASQAMLVLFASPQHVPSTSPPCAHTVIHTVLHPCHAGTPWTMRRLCWRDAKHNTSTGGCMQQHNQQCCFGLKTHTSCAE